MSKNTPTTFEDENKHETSIEMLEQKIEHVATRVVEKFTSAKDIALNVVEKAKDISETIAETTDILLQVPEQFFLTEKKEEIKIYLRLTALTVKIKYPSVTHITVEDLTNAVKKFPFYKYHDEMIRFMEVEKLKKPKTIIKEEKKEEEPEEEEPEEVKNKKPDPLKFMIALGLHLLCWVIAILLSVFPVPVFVLIIIWFVCVSIVTTWITWCVEKCSSTECCRDCCECCDSCIEVWDDILGVILQPEMIMGISVMINFAIVWIIGESGLLQINQFDKMENAIQSINLMWKTGIVSFMVSFSGLIVYEGFVEVAHKFEKNDDDSPGNKWPYEKVVFALLLYDKKDSYGKKLGDIMEKKYGMVFHYALIASVVGITFAMTVDQVETVLEQNGKVTAENVWVWCSVIFTNSYVGYNFIHAITVFMVDNFLLTEYYSGCKTCKKCVDHCKNTKNQVVPNSFVRNLELKDEDGVTKIKLKNPDKITQKYHKKLKGNEYLLLNENQESMHQETKNAKYMHQHYHHDIKTFEQLKSFEFTVPTFKYNDNNVFSIYVKAPDENEFVRVKKFRIYKSIDQQEYVALFIDHLQITNDNKSIKLSLSDRVNHHAEQIKKMEYALLLNDKNIEFAIPELIHKQHIKDGKTFDDIEKIEFPKADLIKKLNLHKGSLSDVIVTINKFEEEQLKNNYVKQILSIYGKPSDWDNFVRIKQFLISIQYDSDRDDVKMEQNIHDNEENKLDNDNNKYVIENDTVVTIEEEENDESENDNDGDKHSTTKNTNKILNQQNDTDKNSYVQ